MLNKKGTTLAEVIISIALISVVLVFMIRLLIDLNNMETNTNFASANQMTRAEIIRMIGNDLNDLELTQVIDNSTENNLSITFNFSNGTNSLITAESDTFTYTDASGFTRTWSIEGGTIYVDRAHVYYSPDTKSEENKIFTLTIPTIPIKIYGTISQIVLSATFFVRIFSPSILVLLYYYLEVHHCYLFEYFHLFQDYYLDLIHHHWN